MKVAGKSHAHHCVNNNTISSKPFHHLQVKSKVPDNILLQVKFVFEKARHGDDASPAEGEGPPVPAKVPPLHVAAPLESSTIIPAGIEDNATGQVTAFAVEEGDGVDSEV